MDDPRVEPVVTRLQIPPGMFGPDPVSIEVRCFLVVGANGVVLIDTGPPGTSAAIGTGLARIDAKWSDVLHIVLTHHHFDHAGGLAESAELASGAAIWAGADDLPEIAFEHRRVIRPVREGDQVGDLRVLHTPGHTPGHVSLLHETASILFIGDLIGSAEGGLTFGPPAFTADPEESLRSLERMIALRTERVLFSHGAEVSDPGGAVAQLLKGS
jgi:glyoxylase-like metal-dependent hydrolase (beta-lactamase superfamily II)